MIRTSIIAAAALITATTAFATPQVMSDEELDSVVAAGLGGTLTGGLTLPDGTVFASGATVDVAAGLIGDGAVDTSTPGGATLSGGGITSTPSGP